MRIGYSVMHRNLKITLTSGETLYGRAYCDGAEGYFVYEYFGGRRREIPAAAISSYESFREEDLGRKAKAYEDLEKMCGEDPVFHMRVLDFALDVLSEVLAEKERGDKGRVRAEAEKEARKMAEGKDDGPGDM